MLTSTLLALMPSNYYYQTVKQERLKSKPFPVSITPAIDYYIEDQKVEIDQLEHST